ncbi:MAG TPA: hypothetical protein PLV68_11265, partial [Ilumatobacteraceae bacterium]|nr:hypothetical protein [Ilumatobacteraceae bacterium]
MSALFRKKQTDAPVADAVAPTQLPSARTDPESAAPSPPGQPGQPGQPDTLAERRILAAPCP